MTENINPTLAQFAARQAMIFRVEGWGEAGLSNLDGFVPFMNFDYPADLAVGESTEGKFQNPGSDKKPEHITRIK